jgi:hypothetical protein
MVSQQSSRSGPAKVPITASRPRVRGRGEAVLLLILALSLKSLLGPLLLPFHCFYFSSLFISSSHMITCGYVTDFNEGKAKYENETEKKINSMVIFEYKKVY